MRYAALLLVLGLTALAAGCLRSTQFQCTNDGQCGAGGHCEAVGFCSFDDPGCMSGRRYGTLSGKFAGSCVGEETPGDSGVADMFVVDDDDDDDDGVLDVSDNCQFVPNPLQGNEDADRFGDACDPCPPVGDADPVVDGDGDMVSDACDPRPSTAGDKIALFEGFHTGGVPTGWTATGTWTQMGDDLAVAAPSGATAELVVTPTTMTGLETVSTSLTIATLNGAGLNSVSVETNEVNNNGAVACSVYRAQGFNPSPGLSLADLNNLGAGINMPYEMAMARYSLRLRRDMTVYDCNAQRLAGPSASSTGTFALANNPYSVGVLVYGVNARLEWFMMVHNP